MPQHMTTTGSLILGATGKLGRALARVWPQGAPVPLLQGRDDCDGLLHWNILNDPAPELPVVSGVIVLAGVTTGDDAGLALNTDLARAGADLARRLGVRALVASSQAVYGHPDHAAVEADTLVPVAPYGRAKRTMEQALAGQDHVCCLRIGNVAGCDSLFDAMTRPPVTLDRFRDGQGPRRAMIGPRDLAQVMVDLLGAPFLPPTLNVARPGTLAMADLLVQAGVDWHWRDAKPDALPELALNVTLLQGISPLPPVTAPDMLAQARAAGWGA
jgi:nucleoside-diphosphate-sugar epimerase